MSRLTDAELAAIEKRASGKAHKCQAQVDRHALLREVAALKAELAEARNRLAQTLHENAALWRDRTGELLP